jgi:putative ABC transport system permease protein
MSYLPFSLALQTMRQNKGRTALTVFGILIGIALVIIVLSAGNGIKGIILNEISSFGDNWVNVEVKVPSASHQSQENIQALSQGVTITTFTNEDVEAIKHLESIKNIYATVTTQATVAYRHEKARPIIFGVSASFIDIDKSEIAAGRFFDEQDDQSASDVVVIGSEIKDDLFGNADAVGAIVKVGSRNYQVIGVMQERGATGFFNMDELIYLPVQTVQKKIMGIDYVVSSVAELEEGVVAASAAEEIRLLMRDRHDIANPDKDDFAVTTMDEALTIVNTIILGLTVLLAVIGGISLLVGGVGIMNVMYVAVAERTFEIGLRKSVGAGRTDILWQFLVEAMLITLLGGLAGIVLGAFVAYGVALGAQSQGLAWDFKISLPSVLLATGFSVAVGLFFGLYPAKKAAALDPIAAMRQE